jgi:NAD(P)-dependent dehydrogenase (short-subunit alcohol dehydrogenase family)
VASPSSIGAKKHAAYSAAKGGTQAIARQAAIEYAEHGVRVNSVAPGPIDSPMMGDVPESTRQAIASILPIGRFAQPVEVADAVRAAHGTVAEGGGPQGPVTPSQRHQSGCPRVREAAARRPGERPH